MWNHQTGPATGCAIFQLVEWICKTCPWPLKTQDVAHGFWTWPKTLPRLCPIAGLYRTLKTSLGFNYLDRWRSYISCGSSVTGVLLNQAYWQIQFTNVLYFFAFFPIFKSVFNAMEHSTHRLLYEETRDFQQSYSSIPQFSSNDAVPIF